jgi:peptidoglycan/LPS O-acetylase OafA/YrhL
LPFNPQTISTLTYNRQVTSEKAPQARLWLIDFVRQKSLLLVLLSHLSLSPFTKDLHIHWALINNGKNAVSLFFVVSGFVIARTVAARSGSLERINVRNFYIMRIARIVPLIAVVCLVGATLSAFPNTQIGGISWTLGHTTLLFWVTMLTFTFNWLLCLKSMQYALFWDIFWSLSMEEQFYFLGPWIAKVSRSEKTLVWILLGVIVLSPVARIIGESLHLASPTFSTFYATDLMAFGVLLHLALQRFGSALKEKQPLCVALLIGGLVALITVLAWRERGLEYRIVYPSAIGVSLFTFLLGGLSIPRIQKCPRPMVFGGELSYGGYLWHPLILGLVGGWTKHMTFPLAALVFTIATLGFAFISYEFYEKPLNSWIRKSLLRKGTSEANAAPSVVPAS